MQRLQAQRQSQARQQGPESTGSLMTHCQPLTGMEQGGSDPAAWAAQPSRPFCSRQQLAYAERARDAADLLGMTMGSGQAGMQAACASVLQQPSLPSYWQAPPWTALLRKCRGNSSQAQFDWPPSCAAEQHQSALPLEHAVDAGVPGAALQQVQEELEALHLRLQVCLQPHCMTGRLLSEPCLSALTAAGAWCSRVPRPLPGQVMSPSSAAD